MTKRQRGKLVVPTSEEDISCDYNTTHLAESILQSSQAAASRLEIKLYIMQAKAEQELIDVFEAMSQRGGTCRIVQERHGSRGRSQLLQQFE
jgi:hypothetical protein